MTMIKRMPKRFLEDAPNEVYDIFDNGGETHDRYDVFLTPFDDCIPFMAFSESGWFYHGDIEVWQFRGYRDRVRRTRLAWNDLPEKIRNAVRFDIEQEATAWAG